MAQCKKKFENDKAFQEGKKDKKIQKLRTDGEEEIHLLMKKLNEDIENVKKTIQKECDKLGNTLGEAEAELLQIIELEKQVKCSLDEICAATETAKNADSEESIKKVKVLMVSPSSSSMGSDNCESKSEVDQASNKHHEP